MAVAETSIVVSHLTTAGISVGVIQWLKSSKYFPWITKEKGNVARYVALVTAAIGAIGIHYTWEPAARVLSFQIPTIAAAFGMAVAYVKSFVVQELTYQATKQPNLSAIVEAVVAKLNSPVRNPAMPTVKQ